MPAIKNPEVFKQGIGITLFGLVVAGGCAGAWFILQDNYWIAQKGPTDVSLEQLAKLEDPKTLPSPWVKVKFDTVVDTGLEMLEVRAGSETVDYRFLLCQAGDRWIIATVPEDFSGTTIDGQIYHSKNDQDIEAFAEIFHKQKEVHGGRLFPFEFRADIDFGENWTAFVYVIGGFGGFGLLLACGGLYQLAQAFREPSDLAGAYGSRNTFVQREQNMEDEWDEELEESRR